MKRPSRIPVSLLVSVHKAYDLVLEAKRLSSWILRNGASLQRWKGGHIRSRSPHRQAERQFNIDYLRFSWPSLISAVNAFSKMANASTCLALNSENSMAPIRRRTKNSSTNVSLSEVM
jgi:hypothetical protein